MEKKDLLEIAAKGVLLLKRMGESIDTENYNYLVYQENRSLPVLINEGLIQSYDIDTVISVIKSCCNLKRNEDTISIENNILDNNSYNGTIKKLNNDTITINLKDETSYLKLKEKLSYYFKKYGYINSRIDDELDGSKTFFYEKKYPEEMNMFQLIQQYECLYHVTSKKNINNILKKGIKAKSADIPYGYMHDERIYLFLKYPTEDNIKAVSVINPVVIKINLEKLPLNYTFYHDPRLNNAVFSYEQIPPEAIEIIN